MSRVLVTGASGFIGRHCLPVLAANGHEVHAVARGPVPETAGVTAHCCNLLDTAATTALIDTVRPTHLLHIAWYAVPGRYWTAPENADWVRASRHLLRVFAAAGGRRLVGAGTCAEYDWSHATLSETTTPLAPATPYGAAKDSTRQDLAAAAPALGVGWAWGRIFFVYGPHEAPGRLVSDTVAALLAGRRIAVTAGEQQRDFMHVEDVARAFVALLEGEHQGPINVASGAMTTVRAVLDRIGALTGGTGLIDFGARPTDPGQPPCLAADTGRLAGLGFVPRYDLSAGLAQTVAWWRDRAA